MKLSAKKKSQIYYLVHEAITNVRIELRMNYFHESNPMRDKIDFVIAQVESPLAQKITKLLEDNSNNK